MRRWLSTTVPVSTVRRNAQLRNFCLNAANTAVGKITRGNYGMATASTRSRASLSPSEACVSCTLCRRWLATPGNTAWMSSGMTAIAPVEQRPGAGGGEQRQSGART